MYSGRLATLFVEQATGWQNVSITGTTPVHVVLVTSSRPVSFFSSCGPPSRIFPLPLTTLTLRTFVDCISAPSVGILEFFQRPGTTEFVINSMAHSFSSTVSTILAYPCNTADR